MELPEVGALPLPELRGRVQGFSIQQSYERGAALKQQRLGHPSADAFKAVNDLFAVSCNHSGEWD